MISIAYTGKHSMHRKYSTQDVETSVHSSEGAVQTISNKPMSELVVVICVVELSLVLTSERADCHPRSEAGARSAGAERVGVSSDLRGNNRSQIHGTPQWR